MKKSRNYTILNHRDKKGEIVPNREINVVVLIGITVIVCLVIVIASFILTNDSLKDEQYRQYEKQLKTEEKSLLKWRLNDEKPIR